MAEFICVDWGTSSFRAYLVGKDGKILDRLRTVRGILDLEKDEAETFLENQLERFRPGNRNRLIICCGMVTSRSGWLETPYLPCPVDIKTIGEKLVEFPTKRLGTILMVPGLCQYHPHADVIRGEESQLAGLAGTGERLAILPGSHSKWVRMTGETISSFLTLLTGELYHALTNHTILRGLPPIAGNQEAFVQGIETGLEQGTKQLLSNLFQTRARMLLQDEEWGGDFLSGLLLGCEIGEARIRGYSSSNDILVAGRPELTSLYCKGLEVAGFSGKTVDEDVVADGLLKLARFYLEGGKA